MTSKIGFIGMGIMGQAMAKNIRAAGHEMMVYNRSTAKTKPLAEQGALVAETPREIGEWTDTVILMLTGPTAIDAVLEGESGLLAGLAPAGTVINMSTVPPAYAGKLAENLQNKGIVLIDAPVSGSKKPAEEGTLVILAGGPREKVEELEPLLLCMGKKVLFYGKAGMGSSMKMTVNLLLGIMMEGLAEAVTFARKCGLDTAAVVDTILAGPLGCGLFSLKEEMLKSGKFPTQFPLKHMAKDLGFVLETAKEQNAAVPGGQTAAVLFNAGLEQGLGDEDFAAIKKILEALPPLTA